MSHKLFEDAKKVLAENDLGGWTRPAPHLYPHQWFWDSCFVAIGYSHFDLERAIAELDSLLKGQWSNGMIPHVIFSDSQEYEADDDFWHSARSPYAPSEVKTTGITQPPMLAEAIWRIGNKMADEPRKQYFGRMLPHLLKYHRWLYVERDPDKDGLIGLLHPWESGLDNNPAWVSELWRSPVSMGMKLARQLGVHSVYEHFRKDAKVVPANQRTDTADLMLYYELGRNLRGHRYDSAKILKRGAFAIDDIGFNAIAVRANELLGKIAKEAGQTLPAELEEYFEKARYALQVQWSQELGEYVSRNHNTHQPIMQPSISGLLPIYAGQVPESHLESMLERINDSSHYGLEYPVPSVPQSSTYFKPQNYWQGPAWINTNWLLIDGLNRAGKVKEAEKLKHRTLKMVDENGFWEYFSPLDGSGAGGHPFSWTAALIIDLLKG